MKVKVCGLTSAEQVQVCVKNGADFCGFILNYPKSHRHVSFNLSKKLTNIEKYKTKFVGVLVNPSNEELEKFSSLNVDYFKIYGNYSEEDFKKIKIKYKKKLIVALQIKNKEDVFSYKKFVNCADIILWDSSGLEKSLEWNYDWMKITCSNIEKMIAGNINIDKIQKISKLADIVDVSGALETNKVKDINKIKNFLEKVKFINDQN